MSLATVPVIQIEVPLGKVSNALDRLPQERRELVVVVDGDGAPVGVERLEAHRGRSEGHAQQMLEFHQVLVVLPGIVIRIMELILCNVLE